MPELSRNALPVNGELLSRVDLVGVHQLVPLFYSPHIDIVLPGNLPEAISSFNVVNGLVLIIIFICV